MAKKITGKIKLQIQGGKANPAPPVGPALGQHGVNIMEFCKQYNAETSDKAGKIIPVEITVYEDRSFYFVLKKPPASFLILEELKSKGMTKGSARPHTDKVGHLTNDLIRKIAEEKKEDMNATTIEGAMQIVRGTARSMGVTCDQAS